MQLRAAAAQVLSDAPAANPERVVVTGGSALYLPRIAAGLSDSPRLEEVSTLLDSAPAEELARGLNLEEERVRALRGAVEIIEAVLEHYALSGFVPSTEGLPHGMLLAFAERGEEWWQPARG